MEIQALLMDEKDNVVTCVKEVKAGEEVVYRKGEDYFSVKAEEDIPFCHKIALIDFEEGDEVLKYGELIGKTTCAVKKGHWISHENIYSVPRDYESEYVKEEA